MHRVAAIAVILLLLPHLASAWGTKEHIQLTRIAVERLIDSPSTPPDMKDWLAKATPGLLDMAGEKDWFMRQRMGIVARGADGLTFWCVMPDAAALMDTDKKVDPYGVPERLLHYIDLELFLAGDAKRDYRHDLSGKPRLENIPHDRTDKRYIQAGFLPFRVEECYQQLVEMLRGGKLIDQPGQYPRDEHATKWAGYLAHYLEDNTQPQHATIDYKSAVYFADKHKSPNVHAQVEYIMADDDKDDHMALRQEFWPIFQKALDSVQDPLNTPDLFKATLEISLASYDALPMIGVAAMAAAKQAGTPEQPRGEITGDFDTEVFFRSKGKYLGREMTVMEMKAHQQAWAVKRVEKILRRAWDEAHAGSAPRPGRRPE